MSDEKEEQEEIPPPPYVPRTNKEINQLAKDLAENRIFTSQHVRSQEDVGSVFMVLALMGPKHAQWMKDNHIVVIYEEYSKAGPWAINGYPSFFSFKSVSKSDWEKVIDVYGRIEAVKKAVMLPEEEDAETVDKNLVYERTEVKSELGKS